MAVRWLLLAPSTPRSSPLGMAIARPGRPTCRSSTPPMAIDQPPSRAQPTSADPRGGCSASLGPSPDTRHGPRLPASGRGFAYTHTRPWGPASPLQLQLACTPKPPTEPPTALQMPRIARCVPAGVGAGDSPMPIRIPRLRAGTPGPALSMAGWLSTADTGPRRGRRTAAPALPLAG